MMTLDFRDHREGEEKNPATRFEVTSTGEAVYD